MYKVIFDTNSIRNEKSLTDFLGGREELERFLKVAEIIIPDIVIEEIRSQKRKHLISKRNAFLSNPFHTIKDLDKNETKNFDIDSYIVQLEKNEKLPFSTIKLTKDGVLEEIKRLSLNNLHPFEENSDKGFKDAYIYFTVLEYLDDCDHEKVFLVTKDNRLGSAFEGNTKISVVKDYEDFENYIDDYFQEAYFVEKLKEEVNEDFSADEIEDVWLNLEGNWILKIAHDDTAFFIEVDFYSKEIIGFTNADFSQNINYLISSGSFHSTHLCIEDIKDYTNYFSNQEVEELLTASVENSQIYLISEDEDVKEFFVHLFESKSQLMADEKKDKFQHYYLKN